MENMLLKLAKQLDTLDEASLMSLWSKYATLTSRFEPTRRWEENCLVFSLIQAKHWKNQLFNYNWSQKRQIPQEDAEITSLPGFDFALEEETQDFNDGNVETCEILSFKPLDKSQSGNGNDKE